MKPHRKAQKKLTETLNHLYGHLDVEFIASEADVSVAFVCTLITSEADVSV